MFGGPYDTCLLNLDSLDRRIDEVMDRTPAAEAGTFIFHVRNLVKSLAELLSEDVSVIDPDGKVTNEFFFGQAFRQYDLEFLGDTVGRVSQELGRVEPARAEASLRALTSYLQAWVDFIVPTAFGDLDEAIEGTSSRVIYTDRLRQLHEGNQSLRRIGKFEQQARQAMQNLKLAAGEGGNERMAQTFESRGHTEAANASKWNNLVMALVGLGILLPLGAIWLEGNFLPQLTGWTAIITKALIAVPLLGLATYSGRISAQHRRMSQHMFTLTAQLDSVRAFTEDLPDASKDKIITALGMRAFSEPGVATPDGAVGIPPEQVMPALEKALDAVKDYRKA